MDKFTAGPWFYDEGSDCILAGTEHDATHIADVRGEGANLPIEANGRLLAAAPELLELLKENLSTLNRIDNYFPHLVTDRIQIMRRETAAAIAKAEGKTV